MNNVKVRIKTLGCKVNQYESELLRENLQKFGYSVAGEAPDAVIINSCTVTAEADSKTRKLVRDSLNKWPEAKVFVTGCYAVREEDIKKLSSLPGVFMVVPNARKHLIPLILNEVYGGAGCRTELNTAISDFGSHTRAFVKVQDGCDQACAYCKIRLVRGRSVSRGVHKILGEIRDLTEKGFKEIVLTGICLPSWKGSGGERFPDLLKEIDSLEGEFRVRLSSVEPNFLDNETVGLITSSKKICAHLHMPLQSGSDRVLALMNRRYTSDGYSATVAKLRQKNPLIGITTDVMVGFPGETKDDFMMTLDLLGRIKPSRLHVFRYSERKGTVAETLGAKVPFGDAKERMKVLVALSADLESSFALKFIGKKVEVLAETRSEEGHFSGYTREYVPVRFNGPTYSKGRFYEIILGKENILA